jgi:uncharacterized phage infection (PIP) family protein YhgE
MSKSLITPVTTSVTKEKFEESLANWEPETKKDSIRMLHFISTITKYSKNLKQSCYSFLKEKTSTSQNAVDPESGLEVVAVTPKIKVYKESEKSKLISNKISKLESQLKKLKDDLKKELELNGIDYEVDDETYYKCK